MCFLLSLKLFCFGITLTSQWKLPGQLTDIHFHKGHCDIVAVIDSVFFLQSLKTLSRQRYLVLCVHVEPNTIASSVCTVDSF